MDHSYWHARTHTGTRWCVFAPCCVLQPQWLGHEYVRIRWEMLFQRVNNGFSCNSLLVEPLDDDGGPQSVCFYASGAEKTPVYLPENYVYPIFNDHMWYAIPGFYSCVWRSRCQRPRSLLWFPFFLFFFCFLFLGTRAYSIHIVNPHFNEKHVGNPDAVQTLDFQLVTTFEFVEVVRGSLFCCHCYDYTVIIYCSQYIT